MLRVMKCRTHVSNYIRRPEDRFSILSVAPRSHVHVGILAQLPVPEHLPLYQIKCLLLHLPSWVILRSGRAVRCPEKCRTFRVWRLCSM